jgi:UDP-N-acetylmuramyl pentapeptide phosphotransferase/UDP-N-acetylglucosamine-1-phosphate transferase
MTATLLLSAGVAAIAAGGMARLLISPRWHSVVLDHPNARSLHDTPTPRTGGLAILVGLTCGIVLAAALHGMAPWLWPPATALLVTASVSFIDDRGGLSAAVRLLLQLGTAAALVVGAGLAVDTWSLPALGTVQFGVAAPAITVVAIVWMMNLYNFMDGLDGLAGGMAVSGFGVLAIGGYSAGDVLYASVAAAIAGAALGYLRYNLPPARLFMGDVGSVSLGLAAAALAIQGVHEHFFDGWVPLLAFSPFIVDATVTVAYRATRGERVWRAHREHCYQRLVLAGWSRKGVLRCEYALMAISAVVSLTYARVGEQGRAVLLSGAVGFYALLYCIVAFEMRRSGAVPRSR